MIVFYLKTKGIRIATLNMCHLLPTLNEKQIHLSQQMSPGIIVFVKIAACYTLTTSNLNGKTDRKIGGDTFFYK